MNDLNTKMIQAMILSLAITSASFARSDDQELNLNETSDAYNYWGGFSRNAPLTGYGTGGYGDITRADFNPNVCGAGDRDGVNCTAYDPDLAIAEWRFIRNIGWRKFTAYGAARKDWWDFKKTQRWPFTNYQKYGYNWW